MFFFTLFIWRLCPQEQLCTIKIYTKHTKKELIKPDVLLEDLLPFTENPAVSGLLLKIQLYIFQ